MKNKRIEECPSCLGRLYLSRYTFEDCGLEISGNFGEDKEIESFLGLSSEELEFIKDFLLFEGRISQVQIKHSLGYRTVKSKLHEINAKLQQKDSEVFEGLVEEVALVNSDLPSTIIKTKLNKSGGKAYASMLRGSPLEIWLTAKGVRNSSYIGLVCEWHIFDAIVKRTRELGGKMYRGDSAAQSGAKLGSDELGFDTIEGFVASTFLGKKAGETLTRVSTYYAAIFAWADVCTNNRSDGTGGYILLNERWK